MAKRPHDQLVVAISSRALFDFEEENLLFEKGDDHAYMARQLDLLDLPAKGGVAMPLVKKLLAFNGPGEDERRVDVVLLSRNDPTSGMRAFRSAHHHGVPLERGVFTRGRPPYAYLKPLGAHLFLSANADDVRAALEAAVAAGAPEELTERYHVLDYLTTMEQAYACADGVLCRSGAGTVAEITALGLPALYVPLPIGNGEQRLNAADVLASGGGRMVLDADLKPSDILDFTVLVSDPERQAAMARAAASTGVQDAAARLGALIQQCASTNNTPTDEENAA